MRTLSLIVLTLSCLTLVGCSGKFWGGAVGGSVGAAAGYEYNARKQMDQIDADLKAGTITQEEYDIRKDQIEKMSVIK